MAENSKTVDKPATSNASRKELLAKIQAETLAARKKVRASGSLSEYIPREETQDLSTISGRDLGHRAAKVRQKSAENFLELGRLVNHAYERWYEPWKKVGRKTKKRSKEATYAANQWNDFLLELGYEDFKRYKKQIAQLAQIGKHYSELKAHLDVLPDSQSALHTIVSKVDKNTPLAKVLGFCSKDLTAAEAKKLFPKKTIYQPPLRININLAEADEVANALIFAVALHVGKTATHPNLQVSALNGLVKMLKKFRLPNSALTEQSLLRTTQQFVNSEQFKNLLVLYESVAQQKRTEDMEKLETQFGKPKKRRDFSKLHV